MPNRPFRRWSGLAAAALSGLVACAPTPSVAPTPRFYHGRAFGSESQFNPLSEILNEGFNTYALSAQDLRLSQRPFGRSLRNLEESLLHTGPTLEHYGWPRLLRNEILPLTAKDGGQWVPNWFDHLAGSGMVSARMTEWFQQHGVSHPQVMSYLTMTASHVLNEVVEQPGPRSADPLVDLLLFDNLGFVVFRSERVGRLFDGPVSFTSWARQPTISPDGGIENAGQSFVLRAQLPRTTNWKFFWYYGNTHLLGASRRLGESGFSLSAGAGWGSNVVLVTDSSSDTRSVALGPKSGLFLDRESSLLASVLWDHTRSTVATVNLYPGWSGRWTFLPGLWVGVPQRQGQWQLGVVSRFGPGVSLRKVGPAR